MKRRTFLKGLGLAAVSVPVVAEVIRKLEPETITVVFSQPVIAKDPDVFTFTASNEQGSNSITWSVDNLPDGMTLRTDGVIGGYM